MDSNQHQFHLEEFKLLHKEIEESSKGCREIMQWTLLASAAMYGWLATHSPVDPSASLTAMVRYIPFVLTFYGSVATAAWMLRVRTISIYLLKIEDVIGAPLLGYERHLRQRRPILTTIGAVFWILLMIGNFIAPLYVIPLKE